jgi:hypothetical protein
LRKKQCGSYEIPAKRRHPKQKNEAPALYEKYTGLTIAAFLFLRNAEPCERNKDAEIKNRVSI